MEKRTIDEKIQFWSPADELVSLIQAVGWTNPHSHLDRAFTITPATLHLANAPLQAKWDLVDAVKLEAKNDPGILYTRMATAVEYMISQGVHTVGSFIDIDPVIEEVAIDVAEKIRDDFKGDIEMVYVNQTLKGVLNPVAREWFDRGAARVDIIGGLPGKDVGREAEHLDIVLGTAKSQGKMAHVHTDQNNRPDERETQLLVEKTVEHGMQGRTVAVHAISTAAQPAEYRENLYKEMEKAGVMVISCPIAFIDSKRNETLAPTHNSITPVDEMTKAGIVVGMGTDNIQDLYLPLSKGNMGEEILQLARTLRWFDLPALVDIATKNGRIVLGLPEYTRQ